MRITIATGSYNDRRYGRPWIASVTFDGAKPVFEFGEFCGDSSEGELTLELEIGKVFARGQKDSRNPRNSAPEFFVLHGESDFEPVSKVEARRLMSVACGPSHPLAAFTSEELRAELDRRDAESCCETCE